MRPSLRIGTRDSQLAVWQATLVQQLLQKRGIDSELVYMKSEGDIDTITPLYAIGVTGVFTKTLDAALLNDRIDIAVHSMKDVPTQMAQGIRQAAVLERASAKDILVYKDEEIRSHLDESAVNDLHGDNRSLLIATGSVRRMAQWKHRYPNHRFEDLRGNVNTRLRKLQEHGWNGAIFAAAGLERIGLRPEKSIDLDWMLPAPAQGAIMIVCRVEDEEAYDAAHALDHAPSAICTGVERDFLSALMGGCSTPISAFAKQDGDNILLSGNVVSPDGQSKFEITESAPVAKAADLGAMTARKLIASGAGSILERIRNKGV